MAFLPNVFNRGNQQQQPQGNQQQQQQNNQNQGNPGGGNSNGSGGPAGGSQGPNNTQFQGTNGNGGQNPSNPLDGFLALLTPSKDVQQSQQQRQQQLSAPLFGDLTPDKIQEQVGKTNFAQNLNPEDIQKALGGDAQTFMNVLNQVAQNAFSASLQMSKGMVEHGVNTGSERFNSTLDSRFRDLQIRNKNSENPALQHPIGQALLGSIKTQIANANPRMNAEEVHSKAEEMFAEFGKLLNPSQSNQQEQNQGGAGKGTNWLEFLDPSQLAQGNAQQGNNQGR